MIVVVEFVTLIFCLQNLYIKTIFKKAITCSHVNMGQERISFKDFIYISTSTNAVNMYLSHITDCFITINGQ